MFWQVVHSCLRINYRTWFYGETSYFSRAVCESLWESSVCPSVQNKVSWMEFIIDKSCHKCIITWLWVLVSVYIFLTKLSKIFTKKSCIVCTRDEKFTFHDSKALVHWHLRCNCRAGTFDWNIKLWTVLILTTLSIQSYCYMSLSSQKVDVCKNAHRDISFWLRCTKKIMILH